MSGGTELQPLAGIGVQVKGIDANNNALEFHGFVCLSQEVAE